MVGNMNREDDRIGKVNDTVQIKTFFVPMLYLPREIS